MRALIAAAALILLAPSAQAAGTVSGAGVVNDYVVSIGGQGAVSAPTVANVGAAAITIRSTTGGSVYAARITSVAVAGSTATISARCSRVKVNTAASVPAGFSDAVDCTLSVTDGGPANDSVAFSAPLHGDGFSGNVAAGDFQVAS